MEAPGKIPRRFLDCVEIPAIRRNINKSVSKRDVKKKEEDLKLDDHDKPRECIHIKQEPVESERPIVETRIKVSKPEDFDLKKIKVKDDVLCLSEDSILRRLEMAGCRPLEIMAERQITEVGFERNALASFLGGSTRLCFSFPGPPWLKIHGLDVVLYPSREFNPHTPLARGEPGLILQVDEIRSVNSSIPLFAKIQKRGAHSSGKTLRYYFGHYELRPAQNLSVEEYAQLDPLTRRTWATRMCKRKWARQIRAGVQLAAQYGRAPTEAEIQQLCCEDLSTDAFPVTADQIDDYFLNGYKIVKISTMNCVRYDVNFQLDLIRKSELTGAELAKEYLDNYNFKRKASQKKTKAAQRASSQSSVESQDDTVRATMEGRKRKVQWTMKDNHRRTRRRIPRSLESTPEWAEEEEEEEG